MLLVYTCPHSVYTHETDGNKYFHIQCRGEFTVRQSGQLTTTLWLDNKEVQVMATNVQPDDRGTVNRMHTDTTTRAVPAPMAIINYNKWMGGVDRGDQLRQYYRLRLKSRKVYKYVFWFLVDASITNAYILHKHYSTSAPTKSLSLKSFRLELAKGLIGGYNSRKRMAPAPSPATPQRRRPATEVAHFPLRRPTGSKKGVARCWHCSHTRHPPQRRETMWYCEKCQLYLCHTGVKETDCFLAHHAAMH